MQLGSGPHSPDRPARNQNRGTPESGSACRFLQTQSSPCRPRLAGKAAFQGPGPLPQTARRSSATKQGKDRAVSICAKSPRVATCRKPE